MIVLGLMHPSCRKAKCEGKVVVVGTYMSHLTGREAHRLDWNMADAARIAWVGMLSDYLFERVK